MLRTSAPLIGALGGIPDMVDEFPNDIEQLVHSLAETLTQAWSYHSVLSGLHVGVNASPLSLTRFPVVLSQIYLGLIDAMFAKVGTIIDRTGKAQSIPTLLTKLTKSRDPLLRRLIPDVKLALNDELGAIKKMERWRHNVVAHKAAMPSDTSFYADNQMDLKEIEGALTELEGLINKLSSAVLNLYVNTHTGTNRLHAESIELCAFIAKQVEAAPSEKK